MNYLRDLLNLYNYLFRLIANNYLYQFMILIAVNMIKNYYKVSVI